MPPLIGLVLLGAGLYAGYRGVMRIASQMREEVQRADEEVRRPVVVEKNLGALEYDPVSGVYRPRPRR